MGLYVPEFWLYSSTALYNLLVLTESHDPPLQCFWGSAGFQIVQYRYLTYTVSRDPASKDFPV